MDLNSGDQIDQLYQEINSAAPERPMTASEPAIETAPAPEAKPDKATIEAPLVDEREFNWKGQKIKAPVEMILSKYAPMGYDYAQKMEAFRADQKKWETEQSERMKPYEKYKNIDEYVQKDPQWWEFVEQQYNERLNSADPNAARLQMMLDEKLKPVTEKLTVLDQKEQTMLQAQQDAELVKSMESIRKKYSDIDFTTPDGSGKSLEERVVEHAMDNGFPTYRSAFLDFYQDQLEKRHDSRAREALTKDAQKKAKLGLSVNQTPKQSGDIDVRGKSWNQLMDEIMNKKA